MPGLKNNSEKYVFHHHTYAHGLTNKIKHLKKEDLTVFVLFPLLFFCFFAILYLISRDPVMINYAHLNIIDILGL